MNHSKSRLTRNAIALKRAQIATRAAGGTICVVIVCNETGSSIAVDGDRKISTVELIGIMEQQIAELRASLPSPPPLVCV